MKIVTVTLNPAFDLHYGMESFRVYEENYVETVSVSAGGKSVNISRALSVNGTENIAYVVMGRDNSDGFSAKLREEGVDFIPVLTDGSIRENITIHSDSGKETRISLDNFSVSEKILWELCDMLTAACDSDTLLAVSGRLPRGISREEATRFLETLRQKTPYLILDSNSFSLEEIIAVKPWLIKPNGQEAETITGSRIVTHAEALDAAKRIRRDGIENVLITLGGDGAVFSGKGMDCILHSPKIKPVSTIGAGDSTIAGFLHGKAKGMALQDCLKTAMAFGAAACLREGTMPPLPEMVSKLWEQVKIEE